MGNYSITAVRSLLLALLFLSISKISHSQDNILDKNQADSLISILQKEKTNSNRLNLLIQISWYHILKPGESKLDLDSAFTNLSQARLLIVHNHSIQLDGYYNLVLSDYYNERGQKKTANELLEKALKSLNSGSDKFLLGTALIEKMYRLDLSSPNIIQKINLVELAAGAYAMTNHKRKLGDCLRLLADLRSIDKNDIRTLPELDSAKRLYQQAKSGDWQQLYILYARYYDRESNNQSALEAILNALRATDPVDNSEVVMELNLYAASLFWKVREYEKCITYCNRTLLRAEKQRDMNTIYNTSYIYIRSISQLGRPNEGLRLLNYLETKYPEKVQRSMYHLLSGMVLYGELKDYQKGRLYFIELERQIQQKVIANETFRFNCLCKMIEFCTLFNKFQKADQIVIIWKDIFKKMAPNLSLRSKLLSVQLGLDTTKKDYHAAVKDLLELKIINDSIFSETRTKILQETEIRYHVERKENENNLQKQKILFLTSQQKLAHAELKSAGFTRNATLISTFCALIIAGLIYRQYANGKKNNRIVGEKNKNLELLLGENEWLMKEMHHRVKNNLQIITSLLNSQSAFLDKGLAKDAIMKSKGRVESISLIHQKLYATENSSLIFMPEYVEDLIGYLKDSLLSEQHIEFTLSIASVHMDVADAVPIGLIINESVTNSIKHAFTEFTGNKIHITLIKNDPEITLVIQDNGSGFVKNQSKGKKSFGLLLINGLCEDLGGKLDMYNDNGTVISIQFNPTVSSTAHLRK